MAALDVVTNEHASHSGTVGQPDLRPEAQVFASLFGSLSEEAASSPAGSGRVVDLGRAGADSRKRSAKIKGASPDATQIAVAELGSRGPAKETVAAASQELTNPRQTAQPSRSARTNVQASSPESSTTDRSPSAAASDANESASTAPREGSLKPSGGQPSVGVGSNAIENQSSKVVQRAAVVPISAASAAATRINTAGPVVPAERAQPAPPRMNVRVVSAPGAAPKMPTSAAQPRTSSASVHDPEVEFAEQLERGFAAVLRQNGGSLTMRLQPEALGELTIRMDLKPGQVAAAFEVESDQAQQLLTSRLSALRSALEARGLNVDSLTVEVSQRSTQDAKAEDQAETWQQQGGARDPGGGAVGEDARGQRHEADGRGTDATPERADIHTRSEDRSWSTAGAGTEESGGARVVRLAIDAIA